MTQNSPNDVPTQTTAVSWTGSLSASERRPLAASHLPAPEFKALSEALQHSSAAHVFTEINTQPWGWYT